ncbi:MULTISPECIES: CvpA family protein [Gammaproteobacteria]|uniref:CvpA family protein n=1 Tax=Gammaproteobacteria TaxID=1236 RepID=UPI000DCF9D66|nr:MULTISPECIES: CvpA family protein [Gammaproteobacteria]RTE86867.1 bacteriocin production protein [Aliidiomarina sp. B3213]TCZ93344.1 bacteriocin production protein [Lysobacter sp. N42]
MQWIDFVIIGIIGLSVVVSLIRGFVREALSLAVWIGAVFVSAMFYADVAVYFTHFEDPLIRNALAVVALFVATLIVGAMVTYLVSQLVEKTGLSGTDRVLGAVFGALRGLLLVCGILFAIDSFTQFSNEEWWQQSLLIPHFGPYIEWFLNYMQDASSFIQPNEV